MDNIDIQALENKLKQCRNINIKDVNIDEVEDIKSINIDTTKSSRERILDFLLSHKNPYLFKVNDSLVKIEFSNSNIYAENCVTNLFKDIYK